MFTNKPRGGREEGLSCGVGLQKKKVTLNPLVSRHVIIVISRQC